jgi:hypothetical protein
MGVYIGKWAPTPLGGRYRSMSHGRKIITRGMRKREKIRKKTGGREKIKGKIKFKKMGNINAKGAKI